MMENPNSVKITLKTAKYILSCTTALVSHYFGRQYDPTTGVLSDEETEHLALYNRVNPLDIDMSHWLSTAISILRLVAGILQNEVNLINDEDTDVLLRGEFIDIPEANEYLRQPLDNYGLYSEEQYQVYRGNPDDLLDEEQDPYKEQIDEEYWLSPDEDYFEVDQELPL